jgi:hypothetical protein
MVPFTVTYAGPVVYVRRERPTDGVYDCFVVATTTGTGSASRRVTTAGTPAYRKLPVRGIAASVLSPVPCAGTVVYGKLPLPTKTGTTGGAAHMLR